MHILDWSIVFGLLLFLITMAIFSKKHTQSVADFLVANRCAGRYLLCVSEGIAGLGAITIIAMFEMYYKAGFTAIWWWMIYIIVLTVISLSGWVAYRFRETRAMTMAQFFEIRYSKKFRIFAGLLAWFSGIVNFGIFPAVGARFFIHFCNLPETMYLGGYGVSTYATIIFALLSIALFFTFMGGQIAVILTDFLQGMFCNVMFIVIIISLFFVFDWSEIIEGISMAPKGQSLIHPFETGQAKDFNIFFYLIIAFRSFYIFMAWQGAQAYNASAISPHEARMGRILSTWRVLPQNLVVVMLAVCAYTFLHHPNFFTEAESARLAINNIGNMQIRDQVTVSIALTYFLPIGIKGGLCAVMLAAFISTHDTYLHSWGSIFVQDVIVPFSKKPFTPKTHMMLLRFSIFGVAVIIFLFSLLFRQTEYIMMFFQITSVIFIGGAGIAIIGGLYWKKGTTNAAWGAMVTGSCLAVLGVFIRQIDQIAGFENPVLAKIASYNGAVLGFYASITAILVYITVSLIERKENFDIDKMLHRDKASISNGQITFREKLLCRFKKFVGVTPEFSLRDKIVYGSTIVWTFSWIAIFFGGTFYNFAFNVKNESWVKFWQVYVYAFLVLSIITTVWFLFGGIKDLKKMFRLLKEAQRDVSDDGTVVGHQNLDEIKNDSGSK